MQLKWKTMLKMEKAGKIKEEEDETEGARDGRGGREERRK